MSDQDVHIVVVEDDPEISRLVERFLRRSGYDVTTVIDGHGLDTVMAQRSVDLVLLDLMLPGEPGLDVCRRVKLANSNTLIIIASALTEVSDRIAGLDTGADDYIAKPFDLGELGARVRAALRRRHLDAVAAPEASLHFAGWHFRPERRALYSAKGVRMALTGAETDLLLVFCNHADQVLTRTQLIELTYGSGKPIEERAVDLMVSRLRRKLAQGGRQLELIRTVRGGGYIFCPQPTGSEGAAP